VVIWSLASANGPTITSRAVLTSSYFFDPTALAVTDDGAVATVGFNIYPLSYLQRNYAVPLIGDELGRNFQPLGVAHFISAPVGQMAVAAPTPGEVTAVTLDTNSARSFVDIYGASPAKLLQDLCTASSSTITTTQWQTYFQSASYMPACPAPRPVDPWNLSITPDQQATARNVIHAAPAVRRPSTVSGKGHLSVPRPIATPAKRQCARRSASAAVAPRRAAAATCATTRSSSKPPAQERSGCSTVSTTKPRALSTCFQSRDETARGARSQQHRPLHRRQASQTVTRQR
jgi:hypothetical protein